jgi:hypothetical protein
VGGVGGVVPAAVAVAPTGAVVAATAAVVVVAVPKAAVAAQIRCAPATVAFADLALSAELVLSHS